MTYRLGLTGGIASGKSTVAAQFRDVGVPVIDADAIAHDLVQPGMPVLAKIVKQFGPTMLRADGQLDRARLAQRVFNDPAALAKLNDLYQPELRDTLTAAWPAPPDRWW